MHNIKRKWDYFSTLEKIIWGCSVAAIIGSAVIFKNVNGMVLLASLVGVTSLLLNAKGNPVGQFLMIIFSIIYGIISFGFAYYGEMITYLCMTMPMAAFSLVAWIKHPYEGNLTEVKVSTLSQKEWMQMTIYTVLITILFYFILDYFNTANMLPSTLSVTTSFLAALLTYKRSHYFALAYAANDIILIVLWVLASFEDFKYVSVVICFVAFLFNDVYGYLNWKRMKERQGK